MKTASALCVLALALPVAITHAGPVAAGNATAGDAKAGEAIYARCLACHALAYDRTGPRHCGLFGRRAGSVKGGASTSNTSPGLRRVG